MEYSLDSMILLSYAVPKFSKKRNSKTFKRILPRKKSSSRRIAKNIYWNLLEESVKRKPCHFINLNFNNEINDNVLNEMRESISKGSLVHLISKVEPQKYFESGPYVTPSPLTPPMTPQVGYEGFQFNSNNNAVLQPPEAEVEGLPLTPVDSEVFAY